MKSQIVERWNRTLKNKMYRLFEHKGKAIWITFLQDLVHSSSKGKTRMYLCPACEHRHVPPTGIRCPHVQQPCSTPLKTTARSQQLASRRARTPSSDENDDYLQCSGRPRCSPRPSTGPGSSSEDDHSQDMFVTHPTTLQGRSARPEEASTQPAALPPVRSTPPVPPPRSSQFRPSAQPIQPDVATMLLEQMRQMQAQNQREFARLEQQGAADRLALQQAIQAFAGRPDQTPANLATVVTGGQRADTPVAIAGPSHSTAGNGDQRPPRVDCNRRPIILSPCGPRHTDELVYIKGDPHRQPVVCDIRYIRPIEECITGRATS